MYEKKEKVWCGSFKTVTTSKGQTFYKISFSSKDIDTLTKHLNEKGYVNLAAFPKFKGTDEYGRSHDLTVDTWKPDTGSFDKDFGKLTPAQQKYVAPAHKAAQGPTQSEIEDLPF
jgi:hypothetical protein